MEYLILGYDEFYQVGVLIGYNVNVLVSIPTIGARKVFVPTLTVEEISKAIDELEQKQKRIEELSAALNTYRGITV